MQLLVVLSTFPDKSAAVTAAEVLVNERLAACVNVLPGVESIYQWQGKVETGQEVLAVIKTTPQRYPALEQRLRELHPYEVPEIVALPASAVAETYLAWVMTNTQP
ncbi:MAG TPA: divalent-cation tolerance protein CutA [Verrucomicrobiales bacterium]|jgi:periplasmic divalent cation tolerance protein|nr:divalent-cation tolerance protein CutA [Verrucomicrobiales bacterium]